MIGLDTNVVVRLFANDDVAQRDASARLIDELLPGERALINSVVLAELPWTLRRVYRFESNELASVVRSLSEHPKIRLADLDAARDAAHRAREEGGEIVDHLISLINRDLGCRTTFTFDEEAAVHSDFTLLES
jgi:predicted nucleic-acid-binding protein